jgi:hypothetical protein
MSLEPHFSRSLAARSQPDSLADVLERVLDKGIVVAGDVVVNVLDIELLTLKLRLFVSSADTAREMGLDWWTRDPFFSGGDGAQARSRSTVEQRDRDDRELEDVDQLRRRVDLLEDMLRQRGVESAKRDDGEQAGDSP